MNWRKGAIKFLLKVSGNKSLEYLDYIKSKEFLPEAEIKKIQAEKLKKLLKHSYEKVPYYKTVLERAGVVTAEGKIDLSIFDKIPFLTKDIIRKEKDRLHSVDKNKRSFYRNTSGGSTGEPVRFIQDKKYKEFNVIANKLYFNYLFGKDLGEKELNLWGSERDISRNTQGFVTNFRNWLYNRRFLNAYLLNDERFEEFGAKINKFKPKVIWSYVESIDLLARYLEKNRVKIHKPKFIVTTAGVLYPEVRSRVEKAFNCPVYNQYGSREAGPMAIECKEKKGLHQFWWSHYFEVIGDEIVVTVLTNYSMPLIRYKIGDTATLSKEGKCDCGMNSLYFSEIEGRIIDHFLLKDGSMIKGGYFIKPFHHKDWVKKFQVVQESISKVICFVVPEGKVNNGDLKNMTIFFKDALGKEVNVKWKFVNKIRPTKSGKYCYTVSLINQDGKR